MDLRKGSAAFAAVAAALLLVGCDSSKAAGPPKCSKDEQCDNKLICIGWTETYGKSKKYLSFCGAKGSAENGGACSRDLECKSAHCLGGRCLDSGEKCKEGDMKVGCDYEVTLDRSKGAAMGIEIAEPYETITAIGDGLVKTWNKKHQEQTVKAGDRIVAINGIPFWSKKMLMEAHKEEKMTIKLVVGEKIKAEKKSDESDKAEEKKSDKSGKAEERKTDKSQKWQRQALRLGGAELPPALVACFAVAAFSLFAGVLILAQRRRRQARTMGQFEASVDEMALVSNLE